MIKVDSIDFISRGFDKNGIAFVSYKTSDSVFCLNTKLERVSGDFEYIKRAGGNLYVFPNANGLEAYFKYENGAFTQVSKKIPGFLSEFNNGVAIVQDEEGVIEDKEVSYYIDGNFNKISPVYLYAEEFSEQGFARVIDLENNYYFVNSNFERVSPLFKDVSIPNNDGLTIAREEINGEMVESYYKFINGEFKRVSKCYDRCFSFTGDLAIVLDNETKKWYLIDKKFNRISKEYDKMSRFNNVYSVVIAEAAGKKVYLSRITGSRVANPNLYNDALQTIEKFGYENAIQAIASESLFDESKRTEMADLRVAVKDYLIKNMHRIGYNHKTRTFFVASRESELRGKTTKALSMWIDEEARKAPARLKALLAQEIMQEE